MAKPRAWTFTTEDGDVMLSETYPLEDLVRDFESGAPIRATTLRGYHGAEALSGVATGEEQHRATDTR
jgi:hypothetical protein